LIFLNFLTLLYALKHKC